MFERPNSLIMTRHLEDDDNLYNFRDGPILPGQTEKINFLAESIRSKIEKMKIDIVVFITSAKKRTEQTAEEIVTALRNSSDVKTIISSTEYLNEGDQGKIIVPENYEPGDHFEGLDLANRIFREETFGLGDNEPNPDYKFGQHTTPDGLVKYPELKEYIAEPGESYKEILYRIFHSIKEFSNTLDRYEDNVLPVLVSHSQIYQILIDLISIAEDIAGEEIDIESINITSECWKRYQERKTTPLPTDEEVFVTDVSLLLDDRVQSSLDYLISKME